MPPTDKQTTPYITKGRQTHHSDWKQRLAKADPPDDPTPVEAMQWRLSTTKGQDFYARRKSTVEPVFGIIKHVMGIPSIPSQGLQKGQWRVETAAMRLQSQADAWGGGRINPGSPISDSEIRKIFNPFGNWNQPKNHLDNFLFTFGSSSILGDGTDEVEDNFLSR